MANDEWFTPTKYLQPVRKVLGGIDLDPATCCAAQARVKALRYYHSEYRAYPHPRSIEAVEYLARKRGNEVGLKYAEAFHVVRKVEP